MFYSLRYRFIITYLYDIERESFLKLSLDNRIILLYHNITLKGGENR